MVSSLLLLVCLVLLTREHAFHLKRHGWKGYHQLKLARNGIVIDFAEEDVKIPENEVYVDPIKSLKSEFRLFPQSPIEFIHNRKLFFGHFMSKDSSSVVNVVTTDKVPLRIDASQIITVWNHDDHSKLQFDKSSWENIIKEGLATFRLLSPRKKTLEKAWEKLAPYRKRFSVVDSYHIGLYLFYESHFTNLVNPAPLMEKLPSLTPVQRYIAAVVLHSDRMHFKRRPSALIKGDKLSVETWISPGGYAPIAESCANSNAATYYTTIFNTKLQKAPNGPSTEQEQIENIVETFYTNKFLQSLQVYAFSDLTKPPKLLGEVVKAMTDKSVCTTETARDLLNKFVNVSSPGNKTVWKLNGKHSAQPVHYSLLSSDALKAETIALGEEIVQRNEQFKVKSNSNKRHKSEKQQYICDFRNQEETSPVITIDTKHTEFFDDGFSISPATNELFIHVADSSRLQSYPNLLQHARERMFSQYTPINGTITRMLPPKVLDSLKLSTETPNEVLTVAVLFDPDSGEVLQTRVFPSIIGPIHSINLEDVDQILADSRSSHSHANQDDVSSSASMKWGLPSQVIDTLSRIYKAVQLLKENELSLCRVYKVKQAEDMKYNRLKQQFETKLKGCKEGYEIMDTLLTLYSNTTHTLCREAHIPVPIVWENRDKDDASIMRRFATQPLRNFISFLQQIQLRAALQLSKSTETYQSLAKYVKLYQLGKQNLVSLLREKQKLNTLTQWE
jgi:hypothetical protein